MDPAVRTPLVRFLDESSGSNRPEDMPQHLREHLLHTWSGGQVACLVSDMSGFTKLTRKYGIIHFASIIARFRQITLPIMKRYHALLITTEADSFNCIFPNAAMALMAANEMQKQTAEANRRLTPEREHFKLTLDGIGVDLGVGPLLDKAGKLHGRTFANAHILGEELCGKGSVALSRRARDEVKDSAEFAGATWKPFIVEGEHPDEVIDAIEDMVEVWEMSLPGDVEFSLPNVHLDSIQPALMPFAKRHDPELSDAAIQELDASIKASKIQQKAVLMFGFDFHNTTDPQMQVGLKYDLLAKVSSIFELHGGDALEDVLVMFDDAASALLAALTVRQMVTKMTPGFKEPFVGIFGFGIHVGEVLIAEGSDVHWGDPVNTSSKLGQDIAEDGVIIISEKVYDIISQDVRLAPYEFKARQETISNVQFNAFEVWDKEIEGKDKKDIIMKEFQRCGSTPGLMVDKSMLASVIAQLTPRFTDKDIQAMFQDICDPDSEQISLEAFLERGCSKEPPGSRLASRQTRRSRRSVSNPTSGA